MPTEYANYLRLALADPTIILGQELLPLSVGHLLYLDKLEVFPPDTPEKLALAVIVCTCKADEILPTLKDPWLEWKVRYWLFRVEPFGEIDWMEKMTIFLDYFEDGTASPTVIKTKQYGDASGLDESGTPFLQHLKASLQAKLNYTPTEALDVPFVQAMWDYYCYHESEGGLVICDRPMRSDMKELADKQHDDIVREAVRMKTERNGG